MKYEELMFNLGSKMIIQQKTSLAASLLMYRKEEDGTADNVIFNERIRVPKWIADYDHGEYAYRDKIKDIIYQDEMKKNRKENSIENNKYQRPARSNWYFGDSGRKNPSLTNSLSTPEAQMM